MVVGFTTACAISAYHHWSCESESHSWWGVLDTTLCDKVCQWLATPIKLTTILLKVTFNAITLTHKCITILYSILNSNKLMTYLFWFLTQIINFIWRVRVMVFNTTFDDISAILWLVSFIGEGKWWLPSLVASQWQSLTIFLK